MDSSNVSVDAVSMASSAISGTTEELFRIWNHTCIHRPQRRRDLQQEAASFFRSLVESTQIQHGNTVLQTKASHESSLSLLIQELGPAFEKEVRTVVRLAALQCLVGALEGCQNSSSSLSTQMTELLANFFLQHAGPIKVAHDYAIPGVEEDEDFEEQLRDMALAAMEVLWKMPPGTETTEIIRMRLRLTQSAVESRCAQPEMPQSASDPSANFISGLSGLPRSRRSLCFRLFLSATESMHSIFNERGQMLVPLWKSEGKWEDLEVEMVSFIRIAISCIYGESDPRCLMQLLELFHSLQTTFTFLTNSKFPIGEMFDAVSPYYPIQFSPPQNNPFNITREGLSNSLLKVLSFTEYDAQVGPEEKMIHLSLGLVLEQILSQDGGVHGSSDEQLEVVKDLQELLLPTEGKKNIQILDQSKMVYIAGVIHDIHSASASAASRGGMDALVSKTVANSCRSLACKIALELEESDSNLLWNAFLDRIFRTVVQEGQYSSLLGRTHLAFLAGVCSCKGRKTLQYALKAGLRPLLAPLQENVADDIKATVLFGLAAFFSSSNVTIQSLRDKGDEISPHPLASFTSDFLPLVCKTMNEHSSEDVTIAAVQALESILVYGFAQVDETTFNDDFHDVIESIEYLFEICTNDKISIESPLLQVLSSLIGHSYNATFSVENGSTLIHTKTMSSFILSTICPRIFHLLFSDDSNAIGTKILELASTHSANAASAVVKELFERLGKSLSFPGEAMYLRSLMTILKSGSVALGTIAQECVSSFVSQHMKELCESGLRPMYAEVFAEAFSRSLTKEYFLKLIPIIETHLPPKSDFDWRAISLVIPVLASACGTYPTVATIDSDVEERATRILEGICELSLSASLEDSLSFASNKVMHSIVACFTSSSNECPGTILLGKLLTPRLIDWDKRFLRGRAGIKELSLIVRSASFLCNACAIRGAESLSTFKSLLRFIIGLATTGKGTLVFGVEESLDLDYSKLPGPQRSSVMIASASATASLVSPGETSGLWRQRLEIECFKMVIGFIEGEGFCLAGGYILCHSSLKFLGKDNYHRLVSSVVQKAIGVFESKSAPDELMRSGTRNVILGALIKSTSTDPDSLRGDLQLVIPLVLRLYLSNDKKLGDSQTTSCKLLALQMLCQVAQVFSSEPIITAVKPAITALLAPAMNENSVILRMAAVETRNTWFMV